MATSTEQRNGWYPGLITRSRTDGQLRDLHHRQAECVAGTLAVMRALKAEHIDESMTSLGRKWSLLRGYEVFEDKRTGSITVPEPKVEETIDATKPAESPLSRSFVVGANANYSLNPFILRGRGAFPVGDQYSISTSFVYIREVSGAAAVIESGPHNVDLPRMENAYGHRDISNPERFTAVTNRIERYGNRLEVVAEAAGVTLPILPINGSGSFE